MGELPEVLHRSRTLFLLEGTVASRSDAERTYQPSILLRAVQVCPCKANAMRDHRCDHLKALLASLDREELIQFILDAQFIPDPVSKSPE